MVVNEDQSTPSPARQVARTLDRMAQTRTIIATLPPRLPVLGLDPGQRFVGVALSDRSRVIASPYLVLDKRKTGSILAGIAEIATKEGVGAIVVGLALHMHGDFGQRAQAGCGFAHKLRTIGVPVGLWDERWSSQAVERMMIDAGTTRRRRCQLIDKLAACWMLQGALDSVRTAHHRVGDDEITEQE